MLPAVKREPGLQVLLLWAVAWAWSSGPLGCYWRSVDNVGTAFPHPELSCPHAHRGPVERLAHGLFIVVVFKLELASGRGGVWEPDR